MPWDEVSQAAEENRLQEIIFEDEKREEPVEESEPELIFRRYYF